MTMKKIKSLLIAFICLFMFFMNINIVRAEEYADCYYNYTNSSDKDFKFQKGFNKGNAALIVQLVYHSKNVPEPILDARLVNASDVDFSNGYDDEFKLSYSSLNCLSTSTICINQLGNSNINLFYSDGSNKLSCPNLYLLKKNHTTGRPNYYFSVLSSTSGLGNIEYDEAHTLSPDSKYSSVKNENTSSGSPGSSGSSNSEKLKSCQYKYTNYPYGGSSLTGTLGFSILKNGSVSQIVASGGLQNTKFKYSGGTLSECPTYLNFTNNAFGGDEITFSKTDNASQADATYISEVTGSDSEIFLSYLAYNSSNAPKIVLLKRGNSIYAETRKGNTQTGEVITINNISDYDFDSQNSKNYPTWINSIEDENGKTIAYEFSKSRDELSKFNYICQEKIFKLYGSESDPNETCLSLFGEDFLIFLNNNVFTIVRLAIPLLLILFTTFDFAKVIFVDDKDGIQKAGKRFGKRLVAAILIFLIPQILVWLANIIGADKVNECADWMEHNKGEINSITDSE